MPQRKGPLKFSCTPCRVRVPPAVLLYGAAGTGKRLLVRAVAAETLDNT